MGRLEYCDGLTARPCLRASSGVTNTVTAQVKHVNAERKISTDMEKNKRFLDHYTQKVDDMSKVSMDVMKPWIAKRRHRGGDLGKSNS